MSGSNAQEGRIFQVGVTNVTAFIQTTFANFPQIWSDLEKTYAQFGPSGYHIVSQISTDFTFQCPEAQYAASTAAANT